jgi:hypothetical protein
MIEKELLFAMRILNTLKNSLCTDQIALILDLISFLVVAILQKNLFTNNLIKCFFYENVINTNNASNIV